MVTTPNVPRGMYFEEFHVGMEFESEARTITEADIVNFAGLSGDYNQIHTDAEFARSTPFGRRVAHGLLVLSVASGLAVQTGFMAGTVLAFREIERWKFSQPIVAGDTIHVLMRVTETKPVPRLRSGVVIIDIHVKNQESVTVQRGRWTVLMQSHRCQPAC